MRLKHLLFGERSLTKVAALFASKAQAESVAQQVKRAAHVDDAQVYLVGPEDDAAAPTPAFSRKLEPEQAGIWHTMIRAHLVMGFVGGAVGVLIWLGLLAVGNPAVKSTPGMALFGFVSFAGAIGLLLGGLLTARPDHSLVIATVRRAIRQGRWALVVHPLTPQQLQAALHELRHRSDRVVRSL